MYLCIIYHAKAEAIFQNSKKKKKIVINLYFKNLRIMLSSVSVYNAVITNLREGLSHMEAYINEGVRVNGNAMCLS